MQRKVVGGTSFPFALHTKLIFTTIMQHVYMGKMHWENEVDFFLLTQRGFTFVTMRIVFSVHWLFSEKRFGYFMVGIVLKKSKNSRSQRANFSIQISFFQNLSDLQSDIRLPIPKWNVKNYSKLWIIKYKVVPFKTQPFSNS